MRWLALLPASIAVACASAPAALGDTALDAAMRGHAVILFGEIHDNAVGHARRADAIERLVAGGARPAIVMEHFDRERQTDIDRVLNAPDATPAKLIEAAGGRGWPWRDLGPVLALAIRERLPIVAANLSRDDARRVMREGPAAIGANAEPVAPEIEAVQVYEIVAGHCGQIDATAARPMARAQVARDRVLAAAVERHAGRGAVLLAGNGHVRRDVGVPRWLSRDIRSRSIVIGMVEGTGGPASGLYDAVIATPVAARADPCASMPSPR